MVHAIQPTLFDRIDAVNITGVQDSLVYRWLHLTPIAIEKISLYALSFAAFIGTGVTLFNTLITLSLMPVIPAAIFAISSFAAYHYAGTLRVYDNIDGIDGEPYFTKIRNRFYREFTAYQKLKEIGGDVSDTLRNMLPAFIELHGYAAIFKYALLPANYKSIFESVQNEMTFCQAFTMYHDFMVQQRQYCNPLLYDLSPDGPLVGEGPAPEKFSERLMSQFLEEIYDRETNQLKIDAQEIIMRYPIDLMRCEGLFTSEFTPLLLVLNTSAINMPGSDYSEECKEFYAAREQLAQTFDNELLAMNQEKRASGATKAYSKSINAFARQLIVAKADYDFQKYHIELEFDKQKDRLTNQRELLGGDEGDEINQELKRYTQRQEDGLALIEAKLRQVEQGAVNQFKAESEDLLRELADLKNDVMRQRCQEKYSNDLRLLKNRFGTSIRTLQEWERETEVALKFALRNHFGP